MREFNECKAEVFRRMEKGIKERKKRRNRIVACCVPLCLCITVFSAAILPAMLPAEKGLSESDRRGQAGLPESYYNHSDGSGKGEPPEISGGVADMEPGEQDNGYNGFVHWNDKTVTSSLWEVLQSAAADDYLNIYVVMPVSVQDQDFTYKGKTLKEYSDIWDQSRELINKLEELHKVGEFLKYGEALYTTGTPTGEKWSKQLYDETVAYYGSELLNEYIVDSELLLDKIRSDTETAKKSVEAARREYTKACKEYQKSKLAAEYRKLKEQGINAGLSSTGNTLMILVTKTEFEGLKTDTAQEIIFTVEASAGSNRNDDLQIPQDETE